MSREPVRPLVAAEYLAAQGQRALAADGRTLELGLSVSVREGELFVTGKVQSEARKAAVGEVLREALPGLSVHNQVTVLHLDERHEGELLE